MKIRKTVIILVIIIILLIGGIFVFNKINNKKEIEELEIIPQEEISEEQLRQTIVTLYYKNVDTKELMPEARKIDVNILAKTPYETLINMLLEEPKNEKMERTIPNGTILNKAELKGNVLYIDFSKEFIDNHQGTKQEEEKTINSIVNTVTELTEIEFIKIIIDGEENKGFNDGGIVFNEQFSKIR